ncbi:hypothetical protein [Streptomyces sp. NRRL S-646]|uniref:hypothetical protein n=1 Tax=Streptomyces sp. NRRL S-646 TaxID=1463917 RepID=UPI003B63D66E
MLAVRADVVAHPFDAEPVAPARNGPVGCWLQSRYRDLSPSLAALAAGLGATPFTSVTWRHGSRGELRSRFAALRVRPAGKAAERPIKAAASAEQGWWDGVLPDCRLLIEWPADAEAPTDYLLSNLPADIPIADLVRLAKARRRPAELVAHASGMRQFRLKTAARSQCRVGRRGAWWCPAAR